MPDEPLPEEPETPEVPRDSILKTIKKMLNLTEDYTPFDPEIIVYINGTFSTLHQLGVGTKTPFSITGYDAEWSEFMGDNEAIMSVKTYIYAKVRMLFDPPANSFGQTSLDNIAKEFEWRLNVQSEDQDAGR